MTTSTQMMDHLFRQQAGKMSSILHNHFGFDSSELIEDIIQETFFAALKNWGMKGIPENPEGWLMLVAKNKIINELKRRKRHGQLNYNFIEESELTLLSGTANEGEIVREQIKTLFACCNPVLSQKAQIMLTLKVICGFGDREIANGLLMNEQTVRKGIYRAKNTIKEAGESGLAIDDVDYQSRMDTVLKVLYLMFNEGYHSTSGEKILDEDISFEAIRLTSWLLDLQDIDHGKVHALLALMYFNFSRFDARATIDGDIIDIEHQDRSKWKKPFIRKGAYHQRRSRENSMVSRYHLESGIASVHCFSPSYEETNWSQIVSYYQKLLQFDDSHLVKINYAVALSENGKSEKGLELLKSLEEQQNENKGILFSAMARIYFNLKNNEMARSYYKVALDLTENTIERKFYESKLTELLLNTNGLNN